MSGSIYKECVREPLAPQQDNKRILISRFHMYRQVSHHTSLRLATVYLLLALLAVVLLSRSEAAPISSNIVKKVQYSAQPVQGVQGSGHDKLNNGAIPNSMNNAPNHHGPPYILSDNSEDEEEEEQGAEEENENEPDENDNSD